MSRDLLKWGGVRGSDMCLPHLALQQLAYWKLDSAPYTDLIGGRVLTNGGDVTSVAGKIGNAVNFPATANSYMTCPDDVPLRLVGTDYTLCFWIYVPTASPNDDIFVGKINNFSANEGWGVFLNTDRSVALLHGNTGVVSTSSIPTAQWTHCAVAYTFASGDVKIWLNRVLASSVGATNSPVVTSTELLYLGWGFERYISPRFVGKIDELGIWTFPWTQCEVDASYNKGAGRTHPFA